MMRVKINPFQFQSCELLYHSITRHTKYYIPTIPVFRSKHARNLYLFSKSPYLPVTKYERILLLARRILVMRIPIFKYDVFWLGVFGVL